MILRTTYFLIFSLILVLFSCNKTKTPKPKDLIPKNTMVNLLMDMHLANRSRNIKTVNGDKKPNYFSLIYKKYKIDSTRFKESHEYYMKELPEYIAIYKKIEDSIFSLLKKEEKKLKIKDSIVDIKNKKKLNEIKLKKQLNLKNRRSLKKKKPFKIISKKPTKK